MDGESGELTLDRVRRRGRSMNRQDRDRRAGMRLMKRNWRRVSSSSSRVYSTLWS